MKEPLRVLQIMGIVNAGGVEAVIMNYYQHINKDNIQFDFVVHEYADKNYINKIVSMGAKVYKVTPYSKNVFKFIYQIYKIIKKENYCIVHSNMNTLSIFPLFAAYIAGAPIRILHNHTTDSKKEKLRSILKRFLRPFAKLFANQYWACSKLAGEWMYGKKAVESEKVTIINNAIDLDKFKFNAAIRERLRKKLELEDKFVIGHVGRFMQQKNHKFLIEIFNEVVKQKSNAHLLLIGDGPLKQEIETKVKSLNLDDKVTFLGIRQDVADLYNIMDVFVLPSLYEGLPVVGVEVQANGLPFICSDKVTREILLTNNIKLLSLQQSITDWCNEIINSVRQDIDYKESTLRNFDIKIEAKNLENKIRML